MTNIYPVVTGQTDSVSLGTSLDANRQWALAEILLDQHITELVVGKENTLANVFGETVTRAKPGKKLGVWVDGKLKLQNRDRATIDEYAAKRIAERHSVWVAPVGSFVEV